MKRDRLLSTIHLAALFYGCSLLPNLAWAQEGLLADKNNNPIQIEADRAELDEQSGTGVYIGNVALIRGELKMLGERLEVRRDEQGDGVTAVLTGQPATVERPGNESQEGIDAQAKKVEYSTAQRLLTLSGAAMIERGKSSMSGEIIRYVLDENRIEAGGGEGRVSFTIDLPPADNAATDDAGGEQP